MDLLSLSGNDCDKGWIGYGDECFKVVMTPVSWSVAQKSCEAEGAILARLDTLAKNVFMTGYLHMFKSKYAFSPGSRPILPHSIVANSNLMFSIKWYWEIKSYDNKTCHH